ncbi:MAG: DUF2306 domain-containing protein [Pseudooceanicola nanhaiensis]
MTRLTGYVSRAVPALLWWALGLAALFLFMAGFIRHSAGLGIAGLTRDLTGLSPFYFADAPVVTAIMYLHMVAGALLIVLAPMQLIGAIRRRWRGYHRNAGRVMIVLGLITGAGGITYAALRGTTGGLFMDISSTAYGLLILVSAVQTYRLGRARQWARHRRWGWRLSVLVIASWFYRVHYVIWDRLTGGLGVTPDMTGPFDQFQAWGFFLGYLLYLELYFLWEDRRKRRSPGVMPRQAPV